jgi:WD40 repeat protein
MRHPSYYDKSKSFLHKIQRQLSALAHEWHTAKQEVSFLARGLRLNLFEKWITETQLSLTPRERAFLEKSLAQRALDAQAELERQAREKQLEKRSQNFLRGLVAVFAVATVIAVGLSAVAFTENGRANAALVAEQDALLAEQAARATSEANFARAEQQRLYLQADNALDDNAIGNVGLALALRSLEYGYTPGADAVLMRASHQGIVRQILTGQQFEINGLSFSPDGKLIATSTEGGTRLYDALTGEELRLLPEEQLVRSVIFSQDNSLLVTTSIDGNINLWDVTSGTIVRTFTNGTTPRYAWFTPDGSQIIGWMPDHFQVWDFASGEPLQAYPFAIDDTHTLLMLPHNSAGDLQFAIQDANNRIYLEDASTGEVTCTLLEANTAMPENHWWTTQYETQDRISFIITDDHVVQAWDINTCTPLARFTGHTSFILDADYDLNQGIVITTDNSGIAIQWSIHTGQEVRRYIAKNGGFNLDISPDNQSLIIADWNEVLVWDMAFPQEPQRFVTDQFDQTNFPRFSPDGQSLYIGGFGKYSRWRFSDAGVSPLITYEQPIRVIAISPDGQYLFAPLENDGSVAYLLDATTGETIQQFRGHEGSINFTDYSSDGTRVVTGSFDLTARVWDVETGEQLQIFEGHTGVVASASFSSDTTMILTTSSDNTARIWDTQTGEEIWSLDNGAPVPYGIFSPDGKLVATADTDGFGHVWDVATGAEIHTLVGHTDTLWSIRFSPDGTLLVTASWDGTARIWDVATGSLVRVLDAGDTKQLYWAEFSPDSEYIVTGSAQNDTVNLWRVDLGEVIASFCGRQPLDLTETQRTQYNVLDKRDICAEQP